MYKVCSFNRVTIKASLNTINYHLTLICKHLNKKDFKLVKSSLIGFSNLNHLEKT